MVISFIRGYYTVIVEGLGTESFLNYLIRNKIYVYNVNRIEKTKIQFDIDRNNFKKLKKIYRNNKFDIKIKKQTGIPFIARRIYTYRGMVICAIISLIILMSTSQFVTDIYIDCPEGIDKKVLRQELEECGLKPGVYKKTINRKIIRDHIMQEIDEVAYLSINVKGTTINNVQKGTKNVLTTSGIIFLKNFSTTDATYIDNIIGITVEAYPLAGITTGIPQKVIVCPARPTMSG